MFTSFSPGKNTNMSHALNQGIIFTGMCFQTLPRDLDKHYSLYPPIYRLLSLLNQKLVGLFKMAIP